MEAVKRHLTYKNFIWLVVVICVYETITKGIVSLALLVLSVFLLPVFVFLEFKSIKNKKGPLGKFIRPVAVLLTVCVLILYICTVGGDTGEVYLFGVYATNTASTVAIASLDASQWAYYLTPLVGLALVLLLLFNRKKRKRAEKK